MKDMTIRMGDTDSIQITDMRSLMRNGVLTAQVTILNDSKSNLVSYRFKWIGKNGMTVTDEEAWKPVTVGKGRRPLSWELRQHLMQRISVSN